MVARTLAALLVVLVTGCAAGSEERLRLPPGQSFAATASLTPRTSSFGDELTATVRVLLDRNRIDPDSIRVLARFSPFRDRTTVDRVDSGNLTALVYRIKLLCLTISCVPSEQDGFYTVEWGARITSDHGPVVDLLFPEARIIQRTPLREFVPENAADVETWPPPWRASVSVAEPTYRASPAALAWVLGGLGALLLAGSVAAAWRLLRRGRLFREPDVSPLDRALALLRDARTDEERRAALEALALALDAEVDAELAEPARALAWSQLAPTDSKVEQLATLAKGETQ
ncbi:MAG TPA: hypothetical protein VM184_02320 [Gaiellaceae bacterium]|nr:hypothetical protein [Gaiellaceae bacterium]